MGWKFELPNDPPWACTWGRQHRWFSDGPGNEGYAWKSLDPDAPTLWPSRGRPQSNFRYLDDPRGRVPFTPVDRDFRCLRCGAVAANRSDRIEMEAQKASQAQAALLEARNTVAWHRQLAEECGEQAALMAPMANEARGRVSFPSLALIEGGMSLAEQVIEWVTAQTIIPHHHDFDPIEAGHVIVQNCRAELDLVGPVAVGTQHRLETAQALVFLCGALKRGQSNVDTRILKAASQAIWYLLDSKDLERLKKDQ